jgi:hypothetical protein
VEIANGEFQNGGERRNITLEKGGLKRQGNHKK